MRLRSDFWVAALLRRCNSEGAVAMLRRRGAAEAGAIFVLMDDLGGNIALYGPAPQSEISGDSADRSFMRLHSSPHVPSAEAEQMLMRQTGFDPDIWIVEIEDRLLRSYFDVLES